MGDWRVVAAEVRKSKDPWQSAAVPALYDLAHALAPFALAGLGIARQDVEELVADLLAARLGEIVASMDPKPFFFRCLRNRAISWRRKKSTRVVEAPDADAPGEVGSTTDEPRLEARHDVAVALALLTERERDVVTAIAEGIEREEIAAAFGTSRANIDQIYRRVKVKLQKAGLP